MSVEANFDPVRVSREDRARNARRDKAARGNLAAMCCDWYNVDPRRASSGQVGVQLAARDFALLADILGLGGPAASPGTCTRCGQPLPFARQTKPHTGQTRGVCARCERRAA